MKKADGTFDTSFNNFIFTVNNITEDAWTNNIAAGAGNIALNQESTVISLTTTSANGGFLLESGPVVDQSFVGGSAIDATK